MCLQGWGRMWWLQEWAFSNRSVKSLLALMATLSGTENVVQRVQHKVDKQQLTLMNVWKKIHYITFY
jgi:Trp operon repressor